MISAVHRPLRRLVLGLVVVELLADLEGGEHVRARLLQRGRELGHGLVAEVRAGRRQLLLGGAHGVVHVDERGAGAVREVVGGDVAELVALRGRRGARPGGPGASARAFVVDGRSGTRRRRAPRRRRRPAHRRGPRPAPELSAVRSPSARAIAAPAQSSAASRGSTLPRADAVRRRPPRAGTRRRPRRSTRDHRWPPRGGRPRCRAGTAARSGRPMPAGRPRRTS